MYAKEIEMLSFISTVFFFLLCKIDIGMYTCTYLNFAVDLDFFIIHTKPGFFTRVHNVNT